MSARAAQVVWTLLAIAAGTGCIPIYAPIVEVSPTTGEKLRAIEDARAAAPDSSPQRARLDALRSKLIGTRPNYSAVIDTYRSQGITVEGYGIFNPGLYAPLDRERKDLERAHARGLLTDVELAELLAVLEQQAERSIVRRWLETCPEAATASVHNGFFGGGSYTPYDTPSRSIAAEDWVYPWASSHAMYIAPSLDKPAHVRDGTIYLSPRP